MAKPHILVRSKKAKASELFISNRLREADALFASVCRSAPTDVESWVMRGLIHRKLGLFAESEIYCRRALAFSPGFAWAHHVLGSALQCQGGVRDAIESYRRAIQLKPDLVEAHYFLANALRETGAMSAAAVSYRQALKLQPDYVEALSNLGAVLTYLGETGEAVQVLNKANAISPNTPQVLCNLGDVLQRDGRLVEALEKYQSVLHRTPNFLDAICNAATLLEKTNQFKAAQALIDCELPHAPGNPSLLVVAAKLARRANKLDEAIVLLEKAAAQKLDLVIAGEVHLLLGQLYDRKGDVERAYTHLAEGNQFLANTLDGGNEDRDRYYSRLEKVRSWLTPELAVASGAELVVDSVPAPIFLFGFPRSGTTLLEQVLDSHSSLQSIDEKGTVSAVVTAFEAITLGRQNPLVELTQDDISQLRKAYFHEAALHVQLQPGHLLVDKMPLNTVNAHLLWRIFPQAKFILAIRHPCDVCLSCFMQNITLNEATSSFFTLEGTAQVYSKVMGLWQDYERALPLNYHRVRYEDLVADFENETRSLLDFLGVGWDDSVLRHTDRALKRGTVSSPSYHQVTQPIYQHAKFRWERYANQFKPLMSVLRPFIDHFGYGE